ncbi:MAG: TlpA disulfide reductase family protein [Verrucomicrobiota bacterium]
MKPNLPFSPCSMFHCFSLFLNKRLWWSFFFIVWTVLVVDVEAQPSSVGEKAKTWGVEQWYQLPEGKKSLDLEDFSGKVIYLYGFQSWCPGCHSHGFPTLQKLTKEFKGDPDVVFVAVQTTFEGFSHNGFEQAKEVAKRYDLKIPFGQSGSPKKPSVLMRNYKTGGTPWTLLIDREGVIRYSDFHISPQQGSDLINKFKKES